MKSLGIIGFGSFGRFMARHLVPFFDVTVYDKKDVTSGAKKLKVRVGSLAETASCDIVVLSVPVQKFEETVRNVSKFVRGDTLVLDVCSVKIAPTALMKKYLPAACEIVGTHPVFGPKSGRGGIKGLRIAVCPVRVSDETLSAVKDFLESKLGLDVVVISPDEHDKQMAYVQGLTHFIGRALNEFEFPPDLTLGSVAFEYLMGIRDLLSLDSDELYKAIEFENPYASGVRRKFLEKLWELNEN
jgi:prephenate dehydrogenase